MASPPPLPASLSSSFSISTPLPISIPNTKFQKNPSLIKASWQELAGVLVFSAIPFTVVKAIANSSVGERLRRRMEETKKEAIDGSRRFKALAERARKDSFWYGEGRPRWLGPIPYEYPPHLTGELPGDYGFDVAGLGKDPVDFQKYFNFEILHARWAMLASLGVIVPELLDQIGIVNFVEPVWWRVGYAKLQGDTLDYLGIPGLHIAGSQGVLVIAICQALLMVYVVYMGNGNNNNPDEVLMQNHQLLSLLHGGSMEKARESHVYSYTNGFRGFAAKLTEEQASQMAEVPGVVSVFPNQRRILHTTHSWDFMGLTNDYAMEIPGSSTKNQGNVIIGFIDTGIWPESPSFSDEGMPPVPSEWKGQCQAGESFSNSTCNKKIIGARYYLNGYQAEQAETMQAKFESPRDSAGHGSHTASTASGRFVKNMNFNGLASGGAHGGAPLSRIAIYKACWDSGCYDADLLAAFDDAIRDGVHILSVSLGPQSPQGDYFNDAISIGSFHAAIHGILVVASAGNEGARGSATNLAPWMFTVGATSTDREFASAVILGSGNNLSGESLNNFGMRGPVETISASEANAGYFTPYQSSYCLESSLDKAKARGKVLVCRHSGSSSESRLEKSLIVKEAGAAGMILVDETEAGLATTFALPAATVGRETGDRILSYANHTRGATSLILPAQTVLGSQPAPRVAAFSSKGPNSLNPEILKPDIVAPGLNILAAWSPTAKGMKFNIISGTSMACPHITGLVALVKAANPSWSSSAIKSAIMTTATVLNKNGKIMTSDPDGRPANPFDYGAGFPDPTKLLNPGLIYDIRPSDYKSFLCSIGYDNESLQKITGDRSICTKPTKTASDLNYPSITVPDLKNTYSVTRTVTNVGKPRSIYRASVSPPNGVNVTVVPKYLSFRKYGQRANFTVNFRVVSPSEDFVFGSLSWKAIGDVQVVTSPLVVRVATSETGLI